MLKNTHNFELYRYQILPINRAQLELFKNTENSIEELLENKNHYFIKAFNNLCSNSYLDDIGGTKKLIFKRIYPKEECSSEDVNIFLMAKPQSLTMETNDFSSKEIQNWPRIHLIVINDKEKQILAVEKRTSAFPSTRNVIRKISERLNDTLGLNNLNVHINPIYDKQFFWDFIADKSIKKIEFSLITPNMANISKALSDELKNMAKTSNTAKTDIRLNAADGTSLIIKRDNTYINDLVEYSSQGGGTIKVQTKGARKFTDINKGITTMSFDSLTLESNNPKNIIDMINYILGEQ
jgi:hypothetical protein